MKIEIKWGYAAGVFRIKKSVPMKIGTESFRDTTLVLRTLLAWSALQRTIIRVPVNGGKPSVLTVFQQAPGGGFSFAGFCWLSPSVSSLGETGGKVLVPFMGFALFTWFEKDGISIHCTRTVVNRIFEKVPKAQNKNKKCKECNSHFSISGTGSPRPIPFRCTPVWWWRSRSFPGSGSRGRKPWPCPPGNLLPRSARTGSPC